MACQVSFGPRFSPRSAPVTFWLIVSSAVLLLAMFAASANREWALLLAAQFSFDPSAVAVRPWTVLTYPLMNFSNPFWFLLMGYCLWWVGADLERWWGSRVHAGFLLAVTCLTALMVYCATLLAPRMGQAVLVGASPLLAALMTVWGLRNPRSTVVLIIVPVTGAVVAVLAVASIWFSYGIYHGLFATLGSAGLGALYFYQGHHFHQVVRKIGPTPEERAARDRDRRFRRIMEQSGLYLVDDDEEHRRRHGGSSKS